MTATPLVWKAKPSSPDRWKAHVGSWTLRIKRTRSSSSATGHYSYCLRMRSKPQHLDIDCGPYTSLAAAQRYAQSAVDQYRLAIEPTAWNTPAGSGTGREAGRRCDVTDEKPQKPVPPWSDADRAYVFGPTRPLEARNRPLEDGELIDDITIGKNQVPAASSQNCAVCGCSTGGLPCAVCMFRGDDPETRVLAQCRRCCLPYEIVANGRTATQAHHDEPHCTICAVIVKKIIQDLDGKPGRSPLFWSTVLVLVGLLVTLGVVVLCKYLE